MAVEDRERGVVKWFSQEKGYGFITRIGGGDVFVHYRDIEADGERRVLEAGWVVEYWIGPGREGKKLQAKEVTVVDKTPTVAREAPTTWTADERRRLAHHLREALAIVEGPGSA